MIKDTKTEGWREALKDKVCSRTDFVSNVQYVHTPWTLGSEMLDKVTESVELAGKRILTINLEFVELLMYDYSVKGDNIVFITDCQKKADICKLPRYAGVKTLVIDFETLFNCPIGDNMKFDVIAGNPPYNAAQENDGKRGGGATLWEKFIEKSISLLKDGGYLCYVHPCGWRSPNGKFTDTKTLLTSKQIKYLEIHNAKQGMDTFGVGTRYDWYVLQNQPTNGKTVVMGEDGKKYEANLAELPFIPNGMLEEIMSLIAKDGEERVEVLYDRTAYGSDKKNMSKEQKGKFQHPVIHSIKKGGLNLLYSNTDQNGHFGVPKVVFGRGQSNTFVDTKGEYGLSQDVRAIVDAPENLDKINAALNNPRFIELSSYCCLISTGMFIDRYNKDILALFRKDFWKAFV
jgi:hypothetical protein